MNFRQPLQFARAAATDFLQDGAMASAAAVAFYTALSFAPLVLLLVTFGAFLGDSAQYDLVKFFGQEMGSGAAEVTQHVVEKAEAENGDRAWWSWALGLGVLLFAASGVFAQLQTALNQIWNVEAAPGRGIMGFVQKRLLSVGMIFAILFILLVSLVISSLLESFIPKDAAVAGRITALLLSFTVFTLLFAAMFKFLPDVRIAWRDVWIGALMTAALFSVGKFALTVYFQYGNVGKNYSQAAGSLIALLVWVYYSSMILFFGAELTQQVATYRGAPFEPSRHARRRPDCETASERRRDEGEPAEA